MEDSGRLKGWSGCSKQGCKELKRKKFEKKIYDDEKMFESERIDARMRKLKETGRKLERELGVLGATEENLMLSFGMELWT